MSNWQLYGFDIPDTVRCVFIHPDTPEPKHATDITIIKSKWLVRNQYVHTKDVVPVPNITMGMDFGDFENNTVTVLCDYSFI